MNNDTNVSLFINVAAIITIFGGSLFTLGLISKSFLRTIFEHVDRLVEDTAHGKNLPAPSAMQQPGFMYIFVKRITDLIFSFLGIVVSLPIMIVVAAGIKLTSPGPVLFRQQQIGLGGRKFYTYKFRTMVSYKVEKALTASTAPRRGDDPRVTRLGKYLRATGLDELPKYFNVFFGHMSIVGTSGAIDYAYVEGLDPSVRAVLLAAKPGLVGLWAFSGSRWRFSFDARLPFDLYYVSHQSFSLDVAISLMVIPSVIGRTASF